MNIIPVNPDNIPQEIKASNRLVNWNLDTRNGKLTKLPINPRTGKFAKVSDSRTWSNWETSWKAYESGKHDGIGYVFGNGIIGVDFDKCRDPETGIIQSEIAKIIQELYSYTEISPSGTGLHVYIKGELPPGARRKDNIEIYDTGRYFTVTGKHLQGTPKEIKENQTTTTLFYNRTFNNSLQPALEKAFASKNGVTIKNLYEGNHPYNSQSEADLALCGQLAYWTNNDTTEIDRLFRASGLMRPKWDEKRPGGTYGSKTIQTAINKSSQSVNTRGEKKKVLLIKNNIGALMKKYDSKSIWLWRNNLAAKEPQMVNGREGIAKTTTCLKMSQEILDEHPDKDILWLATEGAVRNTVIKAHNMGLTTERFIIPCKEDGSFLFNFQRQEDVYLLDDTLESINGNVIAVFIDSLRGCSNLDGNESQLGKLMIKLNSIVCDKHHAALIYIHHWNKSEKKSFLDRSAGNTAITQAVRHVLSVIPDSKTTRKLVVAKSNIDEDCPTLTIIKADKDVVIREFDSAGLETQKDRSEEFLTNLFSKQKEIPSTEVTQLAEREGISQEVLHKTKKRLGIESKRQGDNWYWIWPFK